MLETDEVITEKDFINVFKEIQDRRFFKSSSYKEISKTLRNFKKPSENKLLLIC